MGLKKQGEPRVRQWSLDLHLREHPLCSESLSLWQHLLTGEGPGRLAKKHQVFTLLPSPVPGVAGGRAHCHRALKRGEDRKGLPPARTSGPCHPTGSELLNCYLGTDQQCWSHFQIGCTVLAAFLLGSWYLGGGVCVCVCVIYGSGPGREKAILTLSPW